MVQKQAAYSSRYGNDSFADDDPLAELARIVGFEPEEPQAAAPAARVSPSDEGHFNLEDELLREFEVYDAPQPVEPVVARAEDVPAVPPVPVVENAYREPEASPSYFAPEPSYDHYREEPSFDVDLADELELAVSEADEDAHWQPAQPVAVSAPEPEPEPAPRLRLPLANFSAAPPVSVASQAQPVETSVSAQPQSAVPVKADIDDFSIDDFALESELPAENFDWSPVEHASAPVAEQASSGARADDFFAFDDLIAEADAGKAPVVQPAAVAPAAPVTRTEPSFTFSFSDELAASEDATPAPMSPVSFGTQPVVRSQPVVEPVKAEPARAAVAEDEAFDPFADAEFDLQLDDIELDLSDIEADADMRTARPAMAAPAATAELRPQPVRSVEPAIPVEPVRAMPQPRAPERAAVVEPSFDLAEEPLPFDPAEIAEQEEQPESVAEMDVPEVPVPEAKEPPAAFHHDYDLDLDTELASLFDDAAAAPAVKAHQPAAPVIAAAATAGVATAAAASASASASASAKGVAHQPPPLDDFDAFERALEEDFRRTLSKPEDYRGNASGRINIPLEPQEGIAAARSSTRRLLLTGSAIAVVLLLGAGGLYAWFSGSSVPGISSGTPPVITADKEPVKVVPEDRGGKSVPNQDKAVYDRVAGASVEDPKQQSLISSSEEPVDVVQKTLIPETLPLEGENEAEALGTPVGETEDPRLLPSENQPEQTAAADDDQATITPRKVRTMIVRPDGTLVAQEAPAEPAPVKPAVSEKTSMPPAETKPALAAPTAGRVQPTETAAAPAASVSDAAPAMEQKAVVPASKPVQPTAPAASPASNPATAATPAAPVVPAAPAKPVATETAAAAPAEPAPAPVAPAPAAAAPGSYFIQVASLPSEAEAEKSYKSISGKFASVVGGHAYEIKKAEIAGKGTYYRVRISAGSKADAQALCERFKAAGGSCLVTK